MEAPVISGNIVIMTREELRERERSWYVRGVERGRLEERMDIADGKSPVPTPNPRT